VSCFFINCQGPVIPRAPCQMDSGATPALLILADSLTGVSQGTICLQVPLVEHAKLLIGAESLTPATQGT